MTAEGPPALAGACTSRPRPPSDNGRRSMNERLLVAAGHSKVTGRPNTCRSAGFVAPAPAPGALPPTAEEGVVFPVPPIDLYGAGTGLCMQVPQSIVAASNKLGKPP